MSHINVVKDARTWSRAATEIASIELLMCFLRDVIPGSQTALEFAREVTERRNSINRTERVKALEKRFTERTGFEHSMRKLVEETVEKVLHELSQPIDSKTLDNLICVFLREASAT